MFEKLIELLTRFVVAIEIIAAAMSGTAAPTDPKANGTEKKTSTRKKAAAAEEPEEPEEPEVEKKTTGRKTSTTSKASASKKAASKAADDDADLEELRDEIKQMAAQVAKGDDEDCADEYDDLKEKFGIKNPTKLEDDDVEDFHAELKEILEKYYDVK